MSWHTVWGAYRDWCAIISLAIYGPPPALVPYYQNALIVWILRLQAVEEDR